MKNMIVEITRAYKIQTDDPDEAFARVSAAVKLKDEISDPLVSFADWEEITCVYEEDPGGKDKNEWP